MDGRSVANKRSKTDQLTTLPLKQGRLMTSSVISSLTTPKSSSMDLKKYLQFGLLRTFLKSPKVTRSGGTGIFTKYGVSSSSGGYPHNQIKSSLCIMQYSTVTIQCIHSIGPGKYRPRNPATPHMNPAADNH